MACTRHIDVSSVVDDQAINPLILYPTELRASGVGWALSVAKIASVCGPLIGGALLATKMPVSQVLLVVAIPPLACALFLLVLGRLHWRVLRAERQRAPAVGAEVTGS